VSELIKVNPFHFRFGLDLREKVCPEKGEWMRRCVLGRLVLLLLIEWVSEGQSRDEEVVGAMMGLK
jgi:hypothetical protein